MSYEAAFKIEEKLEVCGKMLQQLLAQKNYQGAKMIFHEMKLVTNGCKLCLLGTMLRTSAGAVGAAKRGQMEQKAALLVEEVLKKEAIEARRATVIRIFGKIVPKFLGPLGAAMIVKDLMNGAMAVSDSVSERMAYNRMAQYGDYIDDVVGDLDSTKTYKQWLATDYLPGQQQKQSKFFQNFKTLFPHSLPV